MTGPDAGCFINIPSGLAGAGIWRDPSKPLLWLYNLNYFDDLGTADTDARKWRADQISRWLAETVPVESPAWDPYVISRRIPAWIKWLLEAGAPVPGMLDSLFAQSRFLARDIETHLGANHVFANAKALLFAGLYFSGDAGARLEKAGWQLFARELRNQVLPDGGHFELSPGYHALIYEDLLDVVNLARAYGRAVPAAWLDTAARMGDWLAAMTHPDGDIAYFNDCARDLGPRPDELFDYAVRLGLARPRRPEAPLADLSASGYARMTAGDFVLFADAAPVGPRVQPGHAHADTLSFELSFRGRRVFVNGGASTYDKDARRQAERGTAAHNTVRLDGRNSSEVWGGFRVARGARILKRAGHVEDGTAMFEAAHDGYARLTGEPIHRRRWKLGPGGLEVVDEISARLTGPHEIEIYFHFHPDIRVSLKDAGRIQAIAPGSFDLTLCVDKGLEWTIEEGYWTVAPRLVVPNTVLVGRASRAGPVRAVTHILAMI